MFLFTSIFFDCNCDTENSKDKNSDSLTNIFSKRNDLIRESLSSLKIDTSNSKIFIMSRKRNAVIDSLISLKFDNTSIEGKAKKILNEFNIQNLKNNFSLAWNDTLIDINFDGKLDLIIYYFLWSGSCKYSMQVYIYNEKKNDFCIEPILSELSNPTINITKKRIEGYCLGNGSMEGYKIKFGWANTKWDTTEYLTFVTKNASEWKVTKTTYPLKDKRIFYIKDVINKIEEL